jgi:hypothetical protein
MISNAEAVRLWTKTKTGRISVMYTSVCRRIKTHPSYKNRKLLFTRKEFKEFALRNDSLDKIYESWKASGFQLRLCPSLDRINNDGDYALNNIQFLPFGENVAKSHAEDMVKRVGRPQKTDISS